LICVPTLPTVASLRSACCDRLCLRDFGFVVISIRIIAVQARGFELRNGC
jgi:hypothetical protein